MVQRIDKYAPLLDSYLALSERLPAMLGWDGPRRYLVLTQNPAELRPTGGYTGSYGIIAFDRGKITERTFQDVFLLDLPWDYPFVKPPTELANYLLGPKQPWQLADANWSPDFPTSAQAGRPSCTRTSPATTQHRRRARDHDLHDRRAAQGHRVRSPSPSTTRRSPRARRPSRRSSRRGSPKPGENRKAFLSTFADQLFASLLGLPPSKMDRPASARPTRSAPSGSCWPGSPTRPTRRVATRRGLRRRGPRRTPATTSTRSTPTSRRPRSSTRSRPAASSLDVAIDSFGNALDTLDVTWDNPIDTPVGKPYRELPTLENLRILGMYFRVLVPDRSRVESVSGGSLVQLTAPALVAEEAGRTVIGTYLMVPPGQTDCAMSWTSPYAADIDETGGDYRLTIQKQPGLRAGPLDPHDPRPGRLPDRRGEPTTSRSRAGPPR